MAKMKLYYSPSSPYARKVRVLATETKLDKKLEMLKEHADFHININSVVGGGVKAGCRSRRRVLPGSRR